MRREDTDIVFLHVINNKIKLIRISMAKICNFFIFIEPSIIFYDIIINDCYRSVKEVFVVDVKSIKGVGSKTAELFGKLNIYSTDDLMRYYPRNYDCYEEPVLIEDIDRQKVVAIKCIISATPRLISANNKMIVNVAAKDEHNSVIRLVWFNMPFLKNKFKIGMSFIFRGRINHKGSDIQMEQPEIFTLAQYEQKQSEMQPIYALTKGLTNNAIIKSMHYLLDNMIFEDDYLPEAIRMECGLVTAKEAITNIHFPKSQGDMYKARRRLAFDEFIKFIYVMNHFKEDNRTIPNEYVIREDDRINTLIDNLPFKLTDAQIKVWNEVKNDMAGTTVMNRLIQGDVGSGKTIIAALALINTALNGYQGALMAPTEVLARQHYEYFVHLIDEYNLPIRISLLIGSMTKKEKNREYDRIETGISKIIIGTHAIIQGNVVFDNLALAITDEQHRFGVNQRQALSEKGLSPHIMVMSATPIPRTLAIILYGDLDISVIDTLPANRLPIKNCVVGTEYRKNAYRFIDREVTSGHQIYVICPMVEESDNFEAENVVEYSEKLKQSLAGGTRIEYLHGKMKAPLKNDIMERFASGSVDVLVSTTVIEVGINVPNATVMMVEDAQRFGLAGLHQLRGRVGRGDAQSYCIFVNTSKDAGNNERLNILNKSNDGFYIASEDMKLRGPGDFFGIRQSGDIGFEIADIYTDADILKKASDTMKAISENRYNLTQEEKCLFENEMEKQLEKAMNHINL